MHDSMEMGLSLAFRPAVALPEHKRRQHRDDMLRAFHACRTPDTESMSIMEPDVHVRRVTQEDGTVVVVADLEPLDDGRAQDAVRRLDPIIQILRDVPSLR